MAIGLTSRDDRNGSGSGTSHPTSRRQTARPTTEVFDCSGTISELGEQTMVRLAFQRKVLDQDGDTIEARPVDDPEFCRDFFSKVDKGIFLQQELLTLPPLLAQKQPSLLPSGQSG